MEIISDRGRPLCLGSLCSRKHDYQGTGQTLRYLLKGKPSNCVECNKLVRLKPAGKPPFVPPEKRFWEFVPSPENRSEDGCWEWTGLLNNMGYGLISVKGKSTAASRFMWYLQSGEMPPSHLFVCHRCDNPKCVNPKHLFLGTIYDNNADMVSKGRQGRGSKKIKSSKLTESKVKEIRDLAASGISSKELALRFGVQYGAIRKIVTRVRWNHVD